MVTGNKETARSKASLTGSQRQRRYREAKKLCSIDISRETLALLDGLRERVGMSTDKTIAAALVSLAAELDTSSLAAAQACVSATAEPAAPTHVAKDTGVQVEAETSPGDVVAEAAAEATPDRIDRPPNRVKRAHRSVGEGPLSAQLSLPYLPHQPKPPANTDSSEV